MPTVKVNWVGTRRFVGTDSNGRSIVIVGQEILSDGGYGGRQGQERNRG